jgi:hypothetical protein
MSRAAKIALSAGVLALTLAGGASLIVSQTKVSPDAIRASVTRSEAGVEKAWKVASGINLQDGADLAVKPLVVRPRQYRERAAIPGRNGNFRNRGSSGTGRCWTGICLMGLTLDELGEVTRLKTNRTVSVLRDLSPEQFEIFGAGAGNHSAIGGYLEAEDLVFVLDVNRDYQPWLIERARLFAVMDTWDGNKKRGLLLIE